MVRSGCGEVGSGRDGGRNVIRSTELLIFDFLEHSL